MYIGPGNAINNVPLWDGSKWVPGASITQIGASVYGDGSDGSFTYDGIATPAWASLAGSVYTLTRNVYHTNATINSGIEVKTANFQFYANGTVTGVSATSIISNRGTDATSLTGASNGASQRYASGGTGGSGTTTNGGNGLGTTSSIGSQGGAAGHGSGTNTGGTSQAATAVVAARGGPHIAAVMPVPVVGRTDDGTQVQGGSGGGGGGGDGSNSGGGGGAGGNILGIFVNSFAGTGKLSAKGGNGFTPTTGQCGGGGGGGGGAVVGYTSYLASWTVDVSGGVHGNAVGAAPATNGSDGSSGNNYLRVLT